jgi:phage terminase Nu1 subunit (DNA packaging protein)
MNTPTQQQANLQTVAVGPLAMLCNLTPARCSQLANEGVMQKAEHGKYYLLPSIHRYIRYLQEGTIGNKKSDYDGAKHPAPDNPRARLSDAQARIAEAEAARLEGGQLPVEAFIRVWSEISTIIKTRLLAIEAAVPTSARVATRSAIHEALNELADHNPRTLAAKIAAEISGGIQASAEPED